MANPVVHFEIMVNGDVDAARRFYAEAFGWKIDASNPMNYGLVDNEGQGIGGGIGTPMHGPGYATFYMEVDDLEQALETIGRLGGKTIMPPMDVPTQPIAIAMFEDPSGIQLGLVQPKGPATAAAPDELELTLSRVVDAPREVAYATWTDPTSFDEWWGPHGMRTPVCEMDLRPGGVLHTVMRDPSGTEYDNQGVFLEVVPNERLVFTDAYEPGWKPAAEPFMTAIISFEDAGDGKTRVTARALHRSVADRVKHEQMGFHQGWGESYQRFAAAVAKRR
jgi:uncharacterized protein YndB with AHSA1/START domain/predicted enzyme related to lactoylglutathione lyase